MFCCRMFVKEEVDLDSIKAEKHWTSVSIGF